MKTTSTTEATAAILGGLSWGDGVLRVDDDDLAAKLRKPYLSPSTAKAMTGCVARWAVERSLPRIADPFGVAEIGTSAHAVFEKMWDLPAAKRSQHTAMSILLAHADEMWDEKTPEGRVIKTNWVSEVRAAMLGYFAIEDPAHVEVHATELKMSELEVGGVPFLGFIDRVTVNSKGLLVIDDVKTGSKPDARKLKLFGDDHGEQVRLYFEALRVATGKRPGGAGLLYTRADIGKRRPVGVSKTQITETVEAFQSAWGTYNTVHDRRELPLVTGGLCGYCPLVNLCPAAKAAGKSDAKGTALDASELSIGQAHAPCGSAHLEDDGPSTAPTTTTSNTQETSMTARSQKFTGAKPYDAEIGGELNPNSFAMGALSGIVTLAYKHLRAAEVKVSKAALDALAQTYAQIVSEIQVTLAGDNPWQDNSNTRARGIFFTLTESSPFPFGADEEILTDWYETTVKHGKALALASKRLYEHELDGDDEPFLYFAE